MDVLLFSNDIVLSNHDANEIRDMIGELMAKSAKFDLPMDVNKTMIMTKETITAITENIQNVRLNSRKEQENKNGVDTSRKPRVRFKRYNYPN